jgi:hypothetical protein
LFLSINDYFLFEKQFPILKSTEIIEDEISPSGNLKGSLIPFIINLNTSILGRGRIEG